MIGLEDLYRQTLAALSGEQLAYRALQRLGVRPPCRVVALGKAAAGMARGAARALGEIEGVAAAHRPSPVPERVRLVLGRHPVPDAASEAAGSAILAEARAGGRDETVLFLISGGGSAIAAAPAPGLTLQDEIEATRALLLGGAPIEEANAVRKHLSAIKGGRLGAQARGGRRVALVLCDIPSGDLASVASGPTTGDPSTFADCLEIVARHRLALPPRVMRHLEAGARGEIEETPKPGDARIEGIENVLLASPRDLARTAGELAGEPCEVEAAPFTGPVEALAARLVARVRSATGPLLLALSGEVTVRVPPEAGSGGRMQHLALLLARELAGLPFEALCAGSDGRDGETAHAGARVDGGTASRAAALGIDLAAAIARHDSAPASAVLKAALPAFDSGTNLCDLVLLRRR